MNSLPGLNLARANSSFFLEKTNISSVMESHLMLGPVHEHWEAYTWPKFQPNVD